MVSVSPTILYNVTCSTYKGPKVICGCSISHAYNYALTRIERHVYDISTNTYKQNEHNKVIYNSFFRRFLDNKNGLIICITSGAFRTLDVGVLCNRVSSHNLFLILVCPIETCIPCGEHGGVNMNYLRLSDLNAHCSSCSESLIELCTAMVGAVASSTSTTLATTINAVVGVLHSGMS